MSMRFLLSVVVVAWVGAQPARAQAVLLPPGAYRTSSAYVHRRPEPAGLDATFPDKRGQLVVLVPLGAKTVKHRLAPDSVWGYVTDKGRTYRLYRGAEYRLVFADTLCIYQSNSLQASHARGGAASRPGYTLAGPAYFFSAGLKGLIFPLTPHYLRELYATSNPAFVARLRELKFDENLTDLDDKTGLYRVTTLYRQATGR